MPDFNEPAASKKQVLYFLLSGIPLILYPAVFFAGVMALASPGGGGEPLLAVLVAKTFLILTLLYPLVYAACLFFFFVYKKEMRSIFIRVPFYYILLCVVLLVSWIAISPL